MAYILIIEDDSNIRETLADILDLSGYEVATAENGRLGYESIVDRMPDLVLCDVNMPELDGFELLATLNQKYNQDVIAPFLFLTAKVEKQDIRTGMNLGADDYILKPFDNNEILSIIKMRLEKRERLVKNNTPQSSNTNSSSQKSINKLAIPTSEGLEFISFNQIIRCEADRAYCTIYIENANPKLVSKPMREFEDELINNGFLKVHKSNIVNLDKVDKFINGKGGMLKMKDGSMVTVSVRSKELVLNALKG